MKRESKSMAYVYNCKTRDTFLLAQTSTGMKNRLEMSWNVCIWMWKWEQKFMTPFFMCMRNVTFLANLYRCLYVRLVWRRIRKENKSTWLCAAMIAMDLDIFVFFLFRFFFLDEMSKKNFCEWAWASDC